ncbi:MAG: restriction endonuclease subunit S, partial [Chloroflexota bacterium]|nr:restriction endonuclease subunit S [Chloroflexota bacterium]
PTDYPYLRVTDFSNYAIDETNLKYLTIEDWQQLKRYTISSDDVYISIAGTTGIVGIVPKRLDKSHLTENAAKIILDNKNEIQKEYLVYYLSSTLGQHQIGIRTTKTSQPKLALTRIKQIPLPQPSIETQRTISRYLSSIDNKISIEINTKKSLESLFNSLLHHLMTGKVRVPYEQRI